MISINLIPTSVQVAMTRRRHIRRWSASVAIAAAALLGAAVLDWTQRARADKLNVEDNALALKVADVRSKLRSVTGESKQLAVQIDRAKALGRKRAWSGMIELIGSCMPRDCWLVSIATDPDKPAHTSAPARKSAGKASDSAEQKSVTIEAPRGILIDGYAIESAQPYTFVANLKRTGVFKTVTLLRSQRENADSLYCFRFELACGW